MKPEDLVRGPILVIGPHPDDEVIAAAGLIAAHCAKGVRTTCAVVTDGARGDFEGDGGANYVEIRRAESRAAGREFGTVEHVFLGFPDGGLAGLLARTPDVVYRAFEDLLRSAPWETVVFPSPFEVHPDHRATSLAVIEAARRCPQKRLLAYEIGEMTPCNLILDVTAYRDLKSRALRAFTSQLKHNDLEGKVAGLNRARTVNCDDPAILACEAYLRIDPRFLDACTQAAEAMVRITDLMAPAPYV